MTACGESHRLLFTRLWISERADPEVTALDERHLLADPLSMNRRTLEDRLKERARHLGFDAVGITRTKLPFPVQQELQAFVTAGLHGTMGWMADTLQRRKDPQALWPEACTAIVCAMNYGPPPDVDPLMRVKQRERGVISVYALGRDYHDVVKGRLKHLAQWFVAQTKAEVKVFVDTAPIMEKPLAAQAGIGWAGKHTCILSREWGNWLFLGVILTTHALAPDPPAQAHCGSCSRCLDICPTGAFLGPHRIDARRCISYLTIEHKGPIPRALRPLMGNRIFGCDDCLAVCPWNRFAKVTQEERFLPREALVDPPLVELASLDDVAFRKRFAKTPVRRAGRERFVANVVIAMGNSGERNFIDALLARLSDESPLVRAMAVWSLSRLMDPCDFLVLEQARMTLDSDSLVRAEWKAATEDIVKET